MRRDMKKHYKKIIAALICAGMILASCVSAAAVSYLPGVTDEMLEPSYWAKGKSATEVLLSADEIKAANQMYIAARGAYLNDLKSVPETLDGYAQRDALAESGKADAAYYLGWTYDKDGNLLSESYFNTLIENMKDRSPAKPQKMRYGIVVNRTIQRSFPSFDMILDDPTDPDFDYMNVSSLRVGEPVAVLAKSADKKFYLAKSVCYTGWVDANDIALCADRDEWLSAWEFDTASAIVVYGDKVYTETSNYDEGISKKFLSIGTVLESAESGAALYGNRSDYYGYPVYIPARNDDGTYRKAEAVIPMHQKVSVGYLPMTQANFAEVFFGTLGNAYGWGGMLDSNDCSGTVRDVYKCFGLELPRNTTWQKAIPAEGYDMSRMCSEEKISLL
ncbi:MAG: SH3 domain-containing protein, partial [Firmicutes bacterium]|nr:SH3 domain-containing protein [Bacillota bacterium]